MFLQSHWRIMEIGLWIPDIGNWILEISPSIILQARRRITCCLNAHWNYDWQISPCGRNDDCKKLIGSGSGIEPETDSSNYLLKTVSGSTPPSIHQRNASFRPKGEISCFESQYFNHHIYNDSWNFPLATSRSKLPFLWFCLSILYEELPIRNSHFSPCLPLPLSPCLFNRRRKLIHMTMA